MITVITPVYNDGIYLKKAIQSVLIQSEVSEYIIIDDGSTDSSWEIIKEFERKDRRIVGLQHSDKKNHGRPRARNLGIQHSSNEWIAFLDADDFYLENRFKNDIEIIYNDKSIDGVYNAIGIFFYDSYTGDKNQINALTTLKEEILPEKLFENMNPISNKGWFHCDGFLVKKKCLNELGCFNNKFYIAQDTELFLKLAIKYKLVPGNLEIPVAKRGVHDKNLFLIKKDIYFFPYTMMYLSLMRFIFKHSKSQERKHLITKKFLENLRSVPERNKFKFFFRYWFMGLTISYQTISRPEFYKVFLDALKFILKFKVKPKILNISSFFNKIRTSSFYFI